MSSPHCALVGFTPDPDFLARTLARVPCRVRTLTFPSGTLFLGTTYGELTETESALSLRLGVLRDLHDAPLSVGEMVRRGLLSPHRVAAAQLRGNGTVLSVSKLWPQFSVYMNLLSVAQLYYVQQGESFVLTDSVHTLRRLPLSLAVDEQAIPYHFLFRLVPGRRTYFAGVRSLLPGEWLSWRAGELHVQLIRDLRGVPPLLASVAPAKIFQQLQQAVTGTAAPQATFLSGGVDSSLIQLALQHGTPSPPHTFSYVVRTPAYDAETHYISAAQRALRSHHTTVEVRPEDYLALLTRTIERVGYPSLCVETDPCIEALLARLDEEAPDTQICFAGHGADALFGLSIARKLALLRRSRRMPGAGFLLRGAAALSPAPKFRHGLRDVAGMLDALRDPTAWQHPANSVACYSDLALARRSFGESVVRAALNERRLLANHYRDAADFMELAHTVDLLTWDYEAAVFEHQLCLAHGRQKRYPFLDESLIRLAYGIAVPGRYIRGTQSKYLLKAILRRHGLAEIAAGPKRGGTFEADLFGWMKHGVLRERVQAIRRPAFLSRRDFQSLLEHPAPFLWALLTWDIFLERVMGGADNES